jgi:hypothetical protein
MEQGFLVCEGEVESLLQYSYTLPLLFLIFECRDLSLSLRVDRRPKLPLWVKSSVVFCA